MSPYVKGEYIKRRKHEERQSIPIEKRFTGIPEWLKSIEQILKASYLGGNGTQNLLLPFWVPNPFNITFTIRATKIGWNKTSLSDHPLSIYLTRKKESTVLKHVLKLFLKHFITPDDRIQHFHHLRPLK